MKDFRHITLGNEKGMVLVICLLMLLMLSLIGIASITTSNSDLSVAENELRQTGSFYAAESGVERAAAAIYTSFESSGAPPSPLPSGTYTQAGYQYAYGTAADGGAIQTILTDGAYRGLYGLVRKYVISSTGHDAHDESSVNITMAMKDALVPLFQFAVFYENDLEIAPGPAMTLGGRVHSNSNMYLQSDNSLSIDSYMTCAGDILHGRKPGSGQSNSNGDVLVKDRNAVYQNMENSDGTWLDSEATNWVNGSLSRWGGLVEDGNHGITELEMPVVVDGPPTDLVDRADGNNDSFEHKAGLKFVDGQAYYLTSPGNWANVTAALITQGVITNGTFYDSREGQNVGSLDINIGALASSGYYPTNGIIYASIPTVSGAISAVRMRNAAELPRATTIATNNPLYTLGNFNSTRKKPAAILSDALTVLSGNWDDNRSQQGLGSRIGTNTQVNASFITGANETGADGQGYCGGFENLIRMLEKWDGMTLTWRGSAVSLWYSRQAVGPWSYGRYYTAPARNWAFDPDLTNIANLPPGTPMVNIVQRTEWSQTIAEAE
jgi:hypothetical protein